MKSALLAVIYFLITITLVQTFPKIYQENIFPKKTLIEWEKIKEGRNQDPHIVGGSWALDGQFPWQVAIIPDVLYFCAGSLIASNWILTAAHCVRDFESFDVRVGSIYSITQGQTAKISMKFIHPLYVPVILQNDVALLRSPIAFVFGYKTNPIKLPKSTMGDFQGLIARVSGWGKTSDNSSLPEKLKYTDLEIISNIKCSNYYGFITNTQMCASGKNLESPCSGDSGGALAVQQENGLWMQVGIVSFGADLGCEVGYPVGFARLSSYIDWVYLTMVLNTS